MDTQNVWRELDEQRRRLVDLLENLSDQEWRQQSLCAGWTVREVAATWPCRTRHGRRCPAES